MHPDWAESSVHVETDSHTVVAGVPDFTVRDEMYSYLRTSAVVRGLAWHEYEGVRRIDHHTHVITSLTFLNGFGSPVDVEPPTLEEVRSAAG